MSLAGGGGGTGPLLGGGGGGAEGTRFPVKGGGTPNLAPPDFSSSGTGVLGGRGGGGGPGLAVLDEARALFGAGWFANLPASAIGGGALKTGLAGGGVASRVGDGGAGLPDELRLTEVSCLVRRAGGGAGGGPRLDEDVLPVF